MALTQVSQVVGPELAGRSVAAALRALAGVSHSIARGLVGLGMVRLNERVVRDAARRVASGDRIDATFDPDTRYHAGPRRAATARTRGFRVVLEDEALIVADKEAGLLTVPAASRPDDTLADRLVDLYARRGVRSPRLWVVHRIDRFTSGLVLFARTQSAALSLISQFERRTARREYLAVCEGRPDPAEGRLVSWLAEAPRSLKMVETRDRKHGKRAVLSYRTEEPLHGAALVRVTLDTGRRNQIRVQFAGFGHPLVGDRAYGRPSSLIGRVALHAARLGFVHPSTRRPIRVESPLPEDLSRLLRRLRRP